MPHQSEVRFWTNLPRMGAPRSKMFSNAASPNKRDTGSSSENVDVSGIYWSRLNVLNEDTLVDDFSPGRAG